MRRMSPDLSRALSGNAGVRADGGGEVDHEVVKGTRKSEASCCNVER